MGQSWVVKNWRRFIIFLASVAIVISAIACCKAVSSFKNSRWQSKVRTRSVETVIANLPSPQKIASLTPASHPRLLADKTRFLEIERQIKADATTREWYAKLHRQADRLIEAPLPKYELADGKRLNKTIHRSIPTLALVYQIEGDRRYLERVWQELKTVAQFPDWNREHFLDTAEMTYAVSLGYDWLYQDLTQFQRSFIAAAIVKHGLKPALAEYQSAAHWTTSERNWNQVCNGGIGFGALAVLDLYPQLASQILALSLEHLPLAMQHYAPDGAWSEGIAYWHYGTFYNTVILAALETSLGNDFDLSAIEGFAQTGLFPIYLNGTTNIPFNFADGDDDFIRAPELFWMSQKYHRPEYSLYQQQAPAHNALDLIWYRPLASNISFDRLPRDRYFREAEIVTMRSGWHNTDGLFVGFKAGDNNIPHSNLDLGTFVIDALGVRWAIELGKDDYGLPGYFDRDGQRWTYYKTRTEGQNTLVIEPNSNPGQSFEAKSKIIRYIDRPQIVSAIADLTPAYRSTATKVWRSISLQEPENQILIRDDIDAQDPVDLFWFMHTEADIQIEPDGKTVILHQSDRQLKIKLLNDNPNYRFLVMKAKPLASSPNPAEQDINSNINKLAIEFRGIKQEQIIVSFSPLV